MAPRSFPQEMVDKVIDEFSGTAERSQDCTPDKRALATLSMVARAWRGLSQRHLFSVIKFREPSSMGVTTKTELAELGQVFSFTRALEINGLYGRELEETFSQPVTIALLRCFRNLESLWLVAWNWGQLGAEQLSACFRHSSKTVTDLTVEGAVDQESLIFLTTMFPQLCAPRIYAHNEETTRVISKEELPTKGSFQGILYLWGLAEDHDDFLIFLASTSLKFEMICIDDCKSGDEVGNLRDSSAATLGSLGLGIDENDGLGKSPGHLEPVSGLILVHVANPTSLSKCTRLQVFHISHPWSETTASLLQTIRSPYLEQIVIHSNLWSDEGLFSEEDINVWTRTDRELCEAYDQWIKHATWKIEVTFDPREEPSAAHLLKGSQEDLKRIPFG